CVAFTFPEHAQADEGKTDSASWVRSFLSEDFRFDDTPKAAPAKAPLLNLFRMPAGFLTDPPGMPDGVKRNVAAPPGDFDRDEDRVHVAFGEAHPFFDFQASKETSTGGYYRLHSQYVLFRDEGSGLCLGLGALMPLGFEANGVSRGQKVISPSLAWYQRL